MEVILIGDIHGRTIWKQIVERHPDADHFVFFGDYFDPYEDIPYWELAKNFKAIVQLKKELGDRVVLLLGNHDLHYYADVEPCSRYDYLNSSRIANLFKESLHLFQVAFEFEGLLCTHAGVSPSWLDIWFPTGWVWEGVDLKINSLQVEKPEAFDYFKGDKSGYGNDDRQGPFWIRPNALIDSFRFTNRNIFQFVGHTEHQQFNYCLKKLCLVDRLGQNAYVKLKNRIIIQVQLF